MAGLGEMNAPLPNVASVESTVREVNGIRLHVVAAGDPADPLVILLHGFPEFWYTWREYVGGFVAAGYRVLVPDQRGYNRSEKPDGIHPYRLRTLSADVVSLIETENRDGAAVIGHDWGATVAWDVALRHPEFVDSLGIINMGHPVAYDRAVRRNLAQLRKSWYAFFFQIPRLPEWYVRRNEYAPVVHQMRDTALSNAFTEADITRYKRAWSEPKAIRSMLNWYRAFVRYRDAAPSERVVPPTQIIWGDDDHTMIPELAETSLAYCDTGTLQRFPDATHWVVHEYPDEVLEILLGHLD